MIVERLRGVSLKIIEQGVKLNPSRMVQAELITHRERYEDLINNELIPGRLDNFYFRNKTSV